jgi:hypothetical protein
MPTLDPTGDDPEVRDGGAVGRVPELWVRGQATDQRDPVGGARHANGALWRVVIVRLATDAPTKTYMARRTQEGMSKQEIIRCLKRYVARELYRELQPRAALAAAA